MKALERFYVVTNSGKDPDGTMTKEVCRFLKQNGRIITQSPTDAECILVLGGDGTVLQAAGDILGTGIPILGINLGTLGYLAEIERKDWQIALAKSFTGEYEVESRMMLEAKSSGTDVTHHALNDVVIARSGPLRILNYDVYVNGQYLGSMNADGIILSTPTGSTAYNLSAGGPIASPASKMILMTPICPHSINARSIIFAAEDVIEIEVGQTSTDKMPTAEVSLDGRNNIMLHSGQRIVVRQSQMVTKLIHISKRSFLETLHKKISF